MTEQEAEALAARVQGIWKCGATPETLLAWLFSPNVLIFAFALTSRIFFNYQSVQGRVRHRLALTDGNKEAENRIEFAALVHQYDWDTERTFILDDAMGHTEKIEKFFLQYVPLFRRNCWLSGCDIEATAHEKAEWIQGFTREELDVWNLKM